MNPVASGRVPPPLLSPAHAVFFTGDTLINKEKTMATRSVTITIPVPSISDAERAALKRAFNADIVRIVRSNRPAGSAITNWKATAKGGKKTAKKKAAKKTTKKKR
jgi:hypothetical protein